MDPARRAENVGGTVGSHKVKKTHCKHGHEYTPETTSFRPDGSRRCLVCRRKPNLPTPEKRVRTVLETRVQQDGDCLRFVGAHDRLGYGRISYQGVNRLAHVLAWEMVNGPVDGLEIDHVYRNGCRHRDCVNVAHLEAVPRDENVRRSRLWHKKGLCGKGIHPQTEPGSCSQCKRDYRREYSRRRYAENPERQREYQRRYQQRKKAAR